jgi:hypothetical protein
MCKFLRDLELMNTKIAKKPMTERIKKQSIRDALQQMTGFQEMNRGGTWSSLCISMGLTQKEWEYIKLNETPMWLHKEDIEEIDNYFYKPKKIL